MSFEVYLIRNSANEKLYVGVTTKGFDHRFNQHLWTARKNAKTSALYAAIRKYGEDVFTVEKLCDCDDFADMNETEVRYISDLNTLSPNGYNLTTGGDAGVFSDELKLKCSMSRMGEKPHKNTSDKLRELWSDPDWKSAQSKRISRGMANSEASKAASLSQVGVPKSESHKAALRAVKAKKVKCVSNGIVFDAFTDAVDWLKENGWPKANHSKIIRACKSDHYTAYGLKWKRVQC